MTIYMIAAILHGTMDITLASIIGLGGAILIAIVVFFFSLIKK